MTPETAPPRRGAPLRVLHVVSHLPPDRIGGVGEVAATIHHGITNAGLTSHVLTSGTTHDDPLVTRVCATPDGFLVASARRLDLALDVDIVHFHHGEALFLLERLRRRPQRPQLVVTLHVDAERIATANRTVDGLSSRSGFVQSRIRDPLKGLLDTRATTLADRVTYISAAGASEMSDDPSEAVVVHNGVHPLAVTGPTAADTDLLFVGTAGPRKGIDMLPAVLRSVRTALPHTTLRIVGFHPDSEPDLVQAFAVAGCADAVDWAGPVQSGDVVAHYRSAKVLVVPSRYEGLPMVILEAGSAALPAVATDVGGTREAVIDQQTGRLVPPADSGSMAAACLDLLTDDTRRTRMGQAIREHVADNFSVDRQVADYLDLYEELTTGRTVQPTGSTP